MKSVELTFISKSYEKYSVDPDRVASSEITDQDLYCFHIHDIQKIAKKHS